MYSPLERGRIISAAAIHLTPFGHRHALGLVECDRCAASFDAAEGRVATIITATSAVSVLVCPTCGNGDGADALESWLADQTSV